ncbi:hypothetical protein JAB5_00260 [Janthinobacterium sp. HH103]|uniref:hypothetical protein n=1 Tax=unclassified Janthinobacterium TaxID=2610881 RepID=UPI000892B407|nr:MULTISPECIES: hypothetical protein [unclassified Janthinobacterium]OEZ64374.1 hypothetical protein JAB2_42240 [Janthinobacterium sp. HH100]OEZ89650.1 hypothetical protein JAB5_00260 [Janthinobacterium sp. HH103]QOU70906.1 hypothetical protein JAB4_002990 [Janthinobacterium sp. HH102]
MNTHEQENLRFAELVTKALVAQEEKALRVLDEAEVTELKELAAKLNGKYDFEDKEGSLLGCMWVCNNNWSCDPSNPPPNCGRCRKVCF